MSKRPNHLASASEEAAKNVLLARSALANACRYGTPEAIAECRELLRARKVERLRADADLLAADPAAARRQVLIISDSDPDVRPTVETHRLLEEAQTAAVRDFVAAHPRDPDPDDGMPSWPRDVRQSYDAILAAFDQSHVALGCSSLAPCRRPAVTVQ